MKNIYEENMKFWELFSKSLDIFTNNFKNILLITLLIYIPIDVLLFYVWEYFLNSSNITFEGFSNYTRIAWWLESLFWVITSIFVILLVKNSLDSKETDFKELFKLSITKWPKVVWANILYSIAVWFWILLLIVPWIYLSVIWVFFLYAIVLNDKSVWESFTYSKKIVNWRWWEIFGYWFFSFMLVILFWLAMWFMPYLETIYMDVFTSLLIDIVALFTVVLFTLKFINIDKNYKDEVVERVEEKESIEKVEKNEL